MTKRFAVTVAKEYLGFSSAHFITMVGHQCESLHGHNYRVGVELVGSLDPECSFVVDFGIVKQIVKPLVERIDHKVLLPSLSDKLEYHIEGDSTVVIYRGSHRFTFPTADVAMVPVANTTAELLAEYFANEIGTALMTAGVRVVEELKIEVEESIGQSASYWLSLVSTG